MRIILLSLLVLANGYYLPKKLTIMKNNNSNLEQNLDFCKTKIKKLERVKQKIIDLSNQNIKYLQNILEEEYATEWDFHNQTYKK